MLNLKVEAKMLKCHSSLMSKRDLNMSLSFFQLIISKLFIVSLVTLNRQLYFRYPVWYEFCSCFGTFFTIVKYHVVMVQIIEHVGVQCQLTVHIIDCRLATAWSNLFCWVERSVWLSHSCTYWCVCCFLCATSAAVYTSLLSCNISQIYHDHRATFIV